MDFVSKFKSLIYRSKTCSINRLAPSTEKSDFDIKYKNRTIHRIIRFGKVVSNYVNLQDIPDTLIFIVSHMTTGSPTRRLFQQ